MIQMTLIQIDNYGPWTVTPRPRTESDLQMLQANLFADLNNHFGNKKLSDDITPIEVELFKHKKDTLDTIVELKTNKKEE